MASRLDHFYGKGLGTLFPEGSAGRTTVPFPRAGRRKDIKDYDVNLVNKTLAAPPEPESFDPRTLHATQPMVTRAGVEHYMKPEHQASGQLFADQHVPGNQNPIVYSRKECEDCPETHMLLSGHHRATAALLQGRQLVGVRIRGGWGGPRR